MVIFYYAWDPTAVSVIDLAPGVLWVVFTFSGLLGLHRSFGVESTDHAIDGLLASPVSREAIFLGKAIANLIFVAAVQLIAIPALMLFYNPPLGRIAAPLVAILLLAQSGLSPLERFSVRWRSTEAGRAAVADVGASVFSSDRDELLGSTAKLLRRPANWRSRSVDQAFARVRHRVRRGVHVAYPFTVED